MLFGWMNGETLVLGWQMSWSLLKLTDLTHFKLWDVGAAIDTSLDSELSRRLMIEMVAISVVYCSQQYFAVHLG